MDQLPAASRRSTRFSMSARYEAASSASFPASRLLNPAKIPPISAVALLRWPLCLPIAATASTPRQSVACPFFYRGLG